MGTTYNVKFWDDGSDELPSAPEIQRSIDALLARFDEQMSTWRDDSELSRFNAVGAGEWFRVSPDTARVVARALELHEITDGASDVTVGPLLRLWGFGARADKIGGPRTAPSSAEIVQAQQLVGAQHLHAREEPSALMKDVDGLEVDLSSIAPGYAVDLIVAQLAATDIPNAMVELGGEVRAVGLRPDGKPWRIGVQSLPSDEEAIAATLPLADLALATSGDFQNFHTVGGEKLTHILNPRTGRPLPYRGASVTVVAPTCFEADGLATALFVMGMDAGYEWCVDHKTAALFQHRASDGNTVLRATPRLQELVGP
jgi:thiamine biosynthesis lipoprotein